jgi:hypothetical protein
MPIDREYANALKDLFRQAGLDLADTEEREYPTYEDYIELTRQDDGYEWDDRGEPGYDPGPDAEDDEILHPWDRAVK